MILPAVMFLLIVCCFVPSSAITCYYGPVAVSLVNDTNLPYTQQTAGSNSTEICYVYREHYCNTTNCTTPDQYTFGIGTYQPLAVNINSLCTAINTSSCLYDTTLGVMRHNYCCSTDYCNAPNVMQPYVSDPTIYCPRSSANGIKSSAMILVETMLLFALVTYWNSR